MPGIVDIASYLPEGRDSNRELLEKFDVNEDFIKNKIGVERKARKGEQEDTSDLCSKAFENLQKKREIDLSSVDVAIVVTQNPDYSLPHSSAIVHKKIGLPKSCACFDISLGCSGYVYGLSVIESFMEKQGFSAGLLFTADPYSKVIDPEDKDTSMIFGDAATATLVGQQSKFESIASRFGTYGEKYESLIVQDGKLSMKGRNIFNFVATHIPKDISKLLEKAELSLDRIDRFYFHPGSKYIVDTLSQRMKLDPEKVVFEIEDYGNTVSSSIPIAFEKELQRDSEYVLISGFGVGLSWASSVLRRQSL